MKNSRKILQIFTLCFCLICVSAGCGTKDPASPAPIPGTQKPPETATQQAPPPTAPSASERRVLADRISRSIEKIDGVQDASVLIADAESARRPVKSEEPQGTISDKNYVSSSDPRQTGNISNETKTSGSGKTSATDGAINQTNTPAPGNQKAPYTAIIGITPDTSMQIDDDKKRSLAHTVRDMVLQEEKDIREAIVTMDETDLETIGNLAGNMMEDSGEDAKRAVNKLRDDLMKAESNLTRPVRDAAKDASQGIEDFMR